MKEEKYETVTEIERKRERHRQIEKEHGSYFDFIRSGWVRFFTPVQNRSKLASWP